MSIKPVDYTSLVPKAQEVSRLKQIEYNRSDNQMELGNVQLEKEIENNINKVRDTNKTESFTIDPNKKNRDNSKDDYEEQDDLEKKDKKDKQEKMGVGSTIDIRI